LLPERLPSEHYLFHSMGFSMSKWFPSTTMSVICWKDWT